MTPVRPALDPELRVLLADMPLMSRLTPEILAQVRQLPTASIDLLLADRQIDRREVTLPVKDGAQLRLSVFSPATIDRTTAAPCVYWIHGGGMVMGDRFSQLDIPLEWLDALGAVVVTVEYRLAPEVTGTTLVDDCYQGLLWTAEHSEELGIDPARIIVAGASAGGGLAAGLTLLARDLGAPAIAAQLLICPMLDHRNTSTSSRQYSGVPGVWTGEMNEFGWRAVLGDLTDDEVPAYVSPSRAEDLSGLAGHLHRRGLRRGLPRRGHRLRHPHLGVAARPNSTSGQAGSTASTPCIRRRTSRPRPAGPVRTGSPGSCATSDRGTEPGLPVGGAAGLTSRCTERRRPAPR